MPLQGYNLQFRLYLEGIVTPFKSANIICTPNGVEASINIYANRAIYDLKPKTSVHIFYRDWVPNKEGRLFWRLMFDGFYSSISKMDQATEGRMVSIVCRDFRMDIRRAPAALAFVQDEELTALNLCNMQGIFQTFVVPGQNKPGQKQVLANAGIREYGGGLNPLYFMLRTIAGTAYAVGLTEQADGEYHYTSKYGQNLQEDEIGHAKCAFFLDGLIRGMWLEAVGGTSVGQFINKRIRVDKRFLIPANRAGYNIWNRQNSGLEIASYVLGNSKFSSLEAAIMRIASLFNVRVYSCNTPSLISIKDEAPGKPNPSVSMIMDDRVRHFLVNRASAEFGGQYILNESMLLPPLEFTAPPNCNIMLPPMYDRVMWQYDSDINATRGYYDQIDSLSTPDSVQIMSKVGVQIPNALFYNPDPTHTKYYEQESVKDQYGRVKPPLTLEERYKGVNVAYGSVEYNLACDDAAAAHVNWIYNQLTVSQIKAEVAKLQTAANRLKGKKNASLDNTSLPTTQKEILEAQHKLKEDAIAQKRVGVAENFDQGNSGHDRTEVALRRHALIKFLNSKYAGAVVTVDMMFNPYIMCGFPGLVIDDEEAAGSQSSKSIIGMVQQVKHLIYISSEGAEASTSVVMNCVRFVDEPTDIDAWGNQLWMKPTDHAAAKIDPDILWYADTKYAVPEPVPGTKTRLNDKFYDLQLVESAKPYIYAKDFLTISKESAKRGASNIIYLDEEYEPQKIVRFYRDVLKHYSPSFMIGTDFEGTKAYNFVYDTIHEATVELRNTHKELLYDYTAAMQFIARDVCHANIFFQGIVGASRLQSDGKYVCNLDDNDSTIIDDKYYGVTDALWNSGKIDGLKLPSSKTKAQLTQNIGFVGPIPSTPIGLMTGPGQFSSILETMPITAFIQERRDAAENYIKEASLMAQGMKFTVPSTKG